MNPKAKITFCGGVSTVTGANFLLESPSGKTRILVDCGLVQGARVAEEINREPFSYDRQSIAALLITHAHLDHVGRIPKLVKEGYSGPIYSTPETKALAEIVLTDAAGILALEAKQNGLEPLYGLDEVNRVFANWKTLPYHQEFKISEEVSFSMKDAGHILGSTMFEITLSPVEGAKDPIKIVFTGDLGNSPAPLLRDTEPLGDVDFLVMESVYGDRNHENREDRLEMFRKVITQTIVRGGTLIIPAFSIDRTQVLLYELN
ncbi:MAG: MBL fold metallo-hydrolase, partial [Candidatus Paceibacterota bacterium]